MIASRSVSCSPSNTFERLGDRQVDVVGDRPALHLHRQALRLQPLAAARRARPQRAVRLELLLLRPAAFLVPAAQVRHQALELARCRNSSTSRDFARQLAERAPSGRCRSRGAAPAAPRAPACGRPCAHGAIAPSASDFDSSGTTRCGSKSIIAPSPWHSGQAPCGELNENARGVISGMLSPQSTHASRRENSRSPPSNELMTTMSSARLSARLDRLGQPALDAAADDQAIDDDLDRVVAAPIELDVLLERAELAVDARLGEAARRGARPAPS